MYLPNYKDGSIVNLMSSIEKAFGGKPKYRPLKILKPLELSGAKNIALLVIDGLGYEFLRKHGKNTVFSKYLKGKITSVFPATTASAITTFHTGVAPQQHAITGWFMFLKEIGIVSVILPFIQRGTNRLLNKIISPKKIFSQKSFSEKIKAQSYIIVPEEIVDSDYTFAYSKKAKRVSYSNSLNDYFRQIENIIKVDNHKKYIYAYWPEFDTLCHKYGTESKQVNNHFKKLDKQLSIFLESINNTTVIITSDHGFIDTPGSKRIELEKHFKLAETLSFPLCGDYRTIYCYIHPLKIEQFKKYITTELRKYCNLYKSEELIKRNYFGLFEQNKKLLDRIGNYTLVMKENFILRSFVAGEKRKFSIGNHSGLSKEEMFVPLVVVNK